MAISWQSTSKSPWEPANLEWIGRQTTIQSENASTDLSNIFSDLLRALIRSFIVEPRLNAPYVTFEALEDRCYGVQVLRHARESEKVNEAKRPDLR